MRRVSIDDPPDVEVCIRCLECQVVLPTPKLFTPATLSTLLRHIYEQDHEIIISARKTSP